MKKKHYILFDIEKLFKRNALFYYGLRRGFLLLQLLLFLLKIRFRVSELLYSQMRFWQRCHGVHFVWKEC